MKVHIALMLDEGQEDASLHVHMPDGSIQTLTPAQGACVVDLGEGVVEGLVFAEVALQAKDESR